MSRRAVILSAVPVSTALCRYVQPDDFVVACDAGYRNAERLTCVPTSSSVTLTPPRSPKPSTRPLCCPM